MSVESVHLLRCLTCSLTSSIPDQMSKLGDKKLREVLGSLGGWPVATADWTPPALSVEALLGRVRRDYNEGVLVEMWVGPDDKNSSVNIIQVRTK